MKAIIDEDLCGGCKICASICPFMAVEMKTDIANGKESLRAKVIDAMCQGCGLCGSACPVGAIKIQQYSNEQVFGQVDAALIEGCVGREK